MKRTFLGGMILMATLLSPGLSRAAGVPADTLRIWNRPVVQIASDPIGQLYQVAEGRLIKYDPTGDSVYSWSDPATGRITFADAGDPMRILVYQKEFNLVTFLNNRLAPLSGPVHLDDVGLSSPLAVASAQQGGFWVIDGTTLQLKHLDSQLGLTVQSAPLTQHDKPAEGSWQLVENGDQLMLLIPGREILVFDLFANFIRKIPVKATAFHAFGNQVVLVYPDRITLYKDAVTTEKTELSATPGEKFVDACPLPGKWLVRTDKQVLLISR